MSTALYEIFFLFGASLLALWIDARFPALAPREIARAMIHVGAALALGYFAASTAINVVAASASPLAAVFGIALPCLTYLMLSSVWFIKVVQATLQGRFR